VLGVNTHNRREEKSRKRNHSQTNVINIAEYSNIKLANEVLPKAKKRSISMQHYNINFSHNFHYSSIVLSIQGVSKLSYSEFGA
jgi:hypothetical protein